MREVEDFLNAYSPAVRTLALAARELILRIMPGVTEKVYPGYKSIAEGLPRL